MTLNSIAMVEHEQNPAAGNLARLLRGMTIGFVATALVLAAMIMLANRPTWWRGYLAASIVSALAAAGSLGPLFWGFKRKLDQLVIAYFTAAGIRAIVSLGGCAWAVWVGGYPAYPTMLMMLCYYFVLLAIETSVVARVTWSSKG
jgi:hypothetical protein